MLRSWRWWLSVLAVVAVGWLTIRASRAEPAKSDWTVAKPGVLALEAPTIDSKTQVALDHVLEQSRLPLLRWVPPVQASPQPPPPLTRAPRLAQQTPSVDGWRSASEPSPAAGAASPPSAAKSPGAPAESRESADVDSHDDTAPFRASPIDSLPTIEFSQTSPGAANQRPAVSAQPIPLPAGPSLGPADAQPHEGQRVEADADRQPPDLLDIARNELDGADDVRQEPRRNAPETSEPPITLDLPAEQPPLPPLSRQLTNLRAKVRGVLKSYYNKPLNSRDNDPWEVMHGMLAYELHSRVRQGGPRGTPITAVGWLCYNRPCKGMTLLYVTPQGELRGKHGVGLQGHHGQFLALLAQCRVSPDYPIRVGEHEFTIHDLIEAEKKTCYANTELTFKLIALVHYLDLDERWVNDQGMEWDIPRLIREELAQPIRGSACGGTHRLAGLSLAVKARKRRGEPLDGEYLRAAQFVEQYENYAFRLQNRDGSLSTRWFQGRGDETDIDRRVKTTGHILEWLVYQLDDEELRDLPMIRAVNYLATLLASNYNHDWEAGPLGHAIHGLVRYDERVFGPYDESPNMAGFAPNPPTARRPQPSRSGRR